MYRLILLLLISGFLISPLKAQKISPEQAERITANLFIYKQWKALTKEGEQILKSGVDFPNLHYRLGIAWFEQGNYMKAVPHLEKSFEYNPGDTILLDYLYWGYLLTNKKTESQKLLNENRLILTKALAAQKKDQIVDNFAITGGYVFSNLKKKSANFDIDGDFNKFGMIDRLEGMLFLNAMARHKISNRIYFNHAFSYINVQRTQIFARQNNTKLIPTSHNNISQQEYFASMDILCWKKLTLLPAVHFLNEKYVDRIFSGPLPPVMDTVDVNANSLVFFLGISRNFKLSKFIFSVSLSNLNREKQLQGNLHWVYFPLGNLNLYTITSVSFQKQDSLIRPVYELKIGKRLMPRTWLEGYFDYGKINNFVSDFGATVYNLPDKIVSKWGFNLLYQFNSKMEIDLYFQHMKREDYFTNYISPQKTRLNYYNYQTNSIIGGIKWIL